MRGALIAQAGASHAHRGIGVEQDRQVRLQVAAENAMQFEHGPATQLATTSLVSFGGIGEAIAENNLPAIERGLNHLRNMLSAGGEHQRHFCQRRKTLRGGVEQHPANLFSGRGSSRLARLYHLVSSKTQSVRQLAQLRALAGTVESFKGDEFSAPRHRGDDSSAGASLYCPSRRLL